MSNKQKRIGTFVVFCSIALILSACNSSRISIHENVDIAYSVVEFQLEGESSVLYLKMGDQPTPRRLYSSRSSVFATLKWVDGQDCLILMERFHEGIHAYEVTSRIDIKTAVKTPILLVDPFDVKPSLKINRDPAKVDPLFLEFQTRPLFSEEYESYMYELKHLDGKNYKIRYGDPGFIVIPNSDQPPWQLGPALLNFGWHLSPDRRYLVYTSFLDESNYERLKSEKIGNKGARHYGSWEINYKFTPPKAVYLADLNNRKKSLVTEGEQPFFWDRGQSVLYCKYDKKDGQKYIMKYDLEKKVAGFIRHKTSGQKLTATVFLQFTPVPEANCLYYPDNVFSLYQLDLETSSVTEVLDWVGVWAVRPAASMPGE